MNWSDERYVRVYTRDTVEWELLPWQSRAVWPLILRKVDRSGVLHVGKHGARGVAALIKMPAEVVEAGIAGLLDDGCLQAPAPDRYVVPNFIEAQEAPQSDALRARESRERRRAASMAPVTDRDGTSRNVTDESRNVTECHAPSHGVTPSHAASHGVTPSVPSVPSVIPSGEMPPDDFSLKASEPPQRQKPGPKSKKLPFRADEASAAVAAASRGRYTHTDEIGKGHAIEIEKAIKKHPNIADWQRLGAYLAAGGDPFPAEKGPTWLAGSTAREAMTRALGGTMPGNSAPAADTAGNRPAAYEPLTPHECHSRPASEVVTAEQRAAIKAQVAAEAAAKQATP